MGSILPKNRASIQPRAVQIDVLVCGPNSFDEARAIARHYWQQDTHLNHWEILGECDLVVEALL